MTKKYSRANNEYVLHAKGLIEIAVSSIPLNVNSSKDDNVHIFLEGETTLSISDRDIVYAHPYKDAIVISDCGKFLTEEEIGTLVLNVEIPSRDVTGTLTLSIKDDETFCNIRKYNINLSTSLDELFVKADTLVNVTGLIPRVMNINTCAGLCNINVSGDLSSPYTFLNLATSFGDITCQINGGKQYRCETRYKKYNDDSKIEDTSCEDNSLIKTIYGIVETESGAIVLI